MEPKDLFTATSILLSAAALLYAWHKDRALRRREHADRVRRAAGGILARLERYRVLVVGFFDDIQPVITEADALLAKEQDLVGARDHLWRGLVAARADTFRRVLSEQIEIAYVDLFGYDTRIHALFTSALQRLQLATVETYNETLVSTQHSTLTLQKQEGQWPSGLLGNELRRVAGELAVKLSDTTQRTLTAFRGELTRLASSTDQEIVNKSVAIASPDAVLPAAPPPEAESRRPIAFYSFKGGVGRTLSCLSPRLIWGLPTESPSRLATGLTEIPAEDPSEPHG